MSPYGEILVRRRSGERWEPISPENATRDGWPETDFGLSQLDWSRGFWRQKATAMLALLGGDAPDDPHVFVPHQNGETWHRIRGRKVRIRDYRSPEITDGGKP